MKDLTALKDRIKERVSLGDILKRKNVISYTVSEEQIPCPFHGVDNHKSARYYKETDTIYCWTCKKKWDLFSYFMEKEQAEFSLIINKLVRTFQVPTDDLPDALEGAISKTLEKRTSSNFDRKKVILETMYRSILELKNTLSAEKYVRLVFAYVLLKNSTPDDKFEEMATKVVVALTKLKGENLDG